MLVLVQYDVIDNATETKMTNGNFDRLYKASELKAAKATVANYEAALASPETDEAGREWCIRDLPRAKKALEEAQRMAGRWWE
jgi:hypothetical protein